MLLSLYPDLVHKNDLSPDAFGAEIDDACNKIQSACKGWGTDEGYDERTLRNVYRLFHEISMFHS